MLYCRRCKLLCDNEKCLKCGSKKLLNPRNTDPIYLTTKNATCAKTVANILTGNNIPYLKQIVLEINALESGKMENFDFFVPLASYEKSKKLIENDLFKCKCK